MSSKYFEKAVELSVIAPCFNEELNIPELATRVLKMFDSGGVVGELLLIDDGSKDRTAEVIREWECTQPGRVVGCFHETNQGIAAGWRTGAHRARGRNVAIIDSDLQYQPEDILRLYRSLLDHSVDIVQGWRSAIGRERGGRYNISRAYNVMLNKTFSMDLRDNKSGFICCNREILIDLLTYRGKYYYWQSFIMVAAHAKGYSCKEVETLFESRKQGESFLDGSTFWASVKSLRDISQAAIEYRIKAAPELSEHAASAVVATSQRTTRAHKHPTRWKLYLSTFNQVHKIITRDVERYHRSLQQSQWLSAASLLDLQDKRLRRLVRHAYRNVPYYRQQLQERGLRPEQIQTRSDLPKLPTLSMSTVRENLYFDITADNIRKSNMLRLTTSSNSHEPSVFFADRRQLEFRWATRLRAKEWAGYGFGETEVSLWPRQYGGSERELTLRQLAPRLAGQSELPLDSLARYGLDGTLRELSALKPALISCTTEALLLLTQEARRSPHALTWKPGAIMVSSQALTQQLREEAEQAFGAPIFVAYTARPFGLVAHECDVHDGMHVVSEGCLVELLVQDRAAQPGELGELVLTDLNNYGMPLIRYRTGDYAVWSQGDCSCGRASPRIGQMRGRAARIIHGADGTRVPSGFFDDLFARYEYAVKHFRVTEREAGNLLLEVVKAGRYSDEVIASIKREIRRQLGQNLRLEFQFPPAIAVVSS